MLSYSSDRHMPFKLNLLAFILGTILRNYERQDDLKKFQYLLYSMINMIVYVLPTNILCYTFSNPEPTVTISYLPLSLTCHSHSPATLTYLPLSLTCHSHLPATLTHLPLSLTCRSHSPVTVSHLL